MTKRRKILLSSLVLAAVGAVAGYGVFSAFTATTANSGNTIASGTVAIGDNDSGSAMWSASNQKPGDSVQKCIKVTYSGSLAASVKIYTTATAGGLDQYLDLTIDTGTGSPTFPGCTGYTNQGNIYTGTLANFASTKNSYTNGIDAYSKSTWAQNDAVVYRFTLTLQDDNNAQNLSSSTNSFTWEARNQ